MGKGILFSGNNPKQSADEACTCKHCGTGFKSRKKEDAFCCNGCEYVFHLINHAGFDLFYSLKGKEIPPVGARAFQERELAWIEPLVLQAESTGSSISHLRLDLQGISCVGCVWLIEKLFQQTDGGSKIVVQPQTAVMELTWETGNFDVMDFAKEIQKFGYWVGPYQGERKQNRSNLALRIGLTGAFAMNTMLFTLPGYLGMESTDTYARLFQLLTFIFATLGTLTGGSYFFSRSFQSLKRGIIHIDLPISLGIGFAYLGSVLGWYYNVESLLYFDFVSVFTFLMLVGRWTQEYAVEKNRNFLLQNNPIPENVESPEGRRIPLDQIEPGQAFCIAPGNIIPVNSQLVTEDASVNLEWINGESEPVQLSRFQNLPSGAINAGTRVLEVRANEKWSDSLMNDLLTAEQEETATPPFLNCILKIYLILVLLLAATGGMAWYLATGSLVLSWQVTLSILVVSCPCALGIAAPLADELAAARVKKQGVFVRNRMLWRSLNKVSHIVFDKTGTLTLEAPEFKNREVLADLDPVARSVLYRLVQSNFHPKSRSLKQALLSKYAEELNSPDPEMTARPEEILGKGLILQTRENSWRLGRADWALADTQLTQSEDTILSKDDTLVAAFRFTDSIREDAPAELERLKSMGFSVELLSGDHPEKVTSMLGHLGLPPDAGLGNQSPHQKAKYLQSFKNKGILMIGDGANDSLAFDEALCCGTPVIEKGILEHKADFFFLGRKLAGIRQLIVVAKQHLLAQRAVFGFAISYNFLAVLLCLYGKMNPLLAAILMPLSSLVSLSIVTFYLRAGSKLR